MFVTPVGSHDIAYSLRGLQNMNQNSRIGLGAIGFPFFLYPAHSAFRIRTSGHGMPGAPGGRVMDQVRQVTLWAAKTSPDSDSGRHGHLKDKELTLSQASNASVASCDLPRSPSISISRDSLRFWEIVGDYVRLQTAHTYSLSVRSWSSRCP